MYNKRSWNGLLDSDVIGESARDTAAKLFLSDIPFFQLSETYKMQLNWVAKTYSFKNGYKQIWVS